ncbi:hypothetical protein HCH_05128 [Hahella chejuensis KCTC 2396]|uniref:Uncharacterized protein n=1 Tax=Hahella chejuensis (strain KCTC 2396) TaxID=349521 RepID=Q2SC16_HAHCH|nr:hypothetical protein HCH_05128 [Hahella chejuensis KCTC 2396]
MAFIASGESGTAKLDASSRVMLVKLLLTSAIVFSSLNIQVSIEITLRPVGLVLQQTVFQTV